MNDQLNDQQHLINNFVDESEIHRQCTKTSFKILQVLENVLFYQDHSGLFLYYVLPMCFLSHPM